MSPKDKETTPERVFKFPRVEAWWNKIRGQGYINGDMILSIFISFHLAGIARLFTLSREELMTPTDYERWFMENVTTPAGGSEWMRNNPMIPAAFAIAYIAMLIIGPKIMENYERPKWIKKYIILWNVLLVIFSTVGTWKTLGTMLERVTRPGGVTFNAHRVMCFNGLTLCEENPIGCLWCFLFCASKIPEMIDTVLLIVTKKKPIFLHWYHHLTVMLFCWLSFATLAGVGTIYACMNFFVHSWMYAWYGLAAYGLKPTRYLSQVVTVLQIVQMIVGSILAVYVYFAKACELHPYMTRSALMIYGSYLILFVKFFITAYCTKRSKKKSVVKTKTS